MEPNQELGMILIQTEFNPPSALCFFPCEAAGCAGCVRPAWPARVAAATVEGSMALEDWEL